MQESGCILKNIRYAGDKEINEKNLKWINSLESKKNYKKIAKFLTDFKTTSNVKNTTLNPNDNYTNYEWWLVKTKDDGWEIVSRGY